MLSIFDHSTGAPLFSSAVTGSGTATWSFVLTPGGSPTPSAVTYAFNDLSAVPEPATLILLAAGFGAAAARRRKKRVRSVRL